jgi:hypothetical protein
MAIGVVTFAVLFVRAMDFPIIFAVPVIIVGALLLGASIAPHWEVSWRGGERRGAWQIAGAFTEPLGWFILTAYVVLVGIDSSGWLRFFAFALAACGVAGAVYGLRKAIAGVEDSED